MRSSDWETQNNMSCDNEGNLSKGPDNAIAHVVTATLVHSEENESNIETVMAQRAGKIKDQVRLETEAKPRWKDEPEKKPTGQ